MDGYSLRTEQELINLKPLKLVKCEVLEHFYLRLEYGVIQGTVIDPVVKLRIYLIHAFSEKVLITTIPTFEKSFTGIYWMEVIGHRRTGCHHSSNSISIQVAS